MKYKVKEVAALQPDYLGFIFYEKSLRNFEGKIPEIPSSIQKVGVFVNEEIEKVIEITQKQSVAVVQLHGEESPNYCKRLAEYNRNLKIWKVFSVGEAFNFNELIRYEKVVSKFLFDTKGKNKGGNGVPFNWGILKKYPSQKQFILSGGIGLEEVDAIKKLTTEKKLPVHAIDINSKFEDQPGLKNITKLKQFFNEL
ncbi:MAG: phosphoribosylanthranilate isomerase [Flavobacteriaceae bacterium]